MIEVWYHVNPHTTTTPSETTYTFANKKDALKKVDDLIALPFSDYVKMETVCDGKIKDVKIRVNNRCVRSKYD